MTLTKAIQILEIETGSRHEPSDPDLFNAQNLALKALEREHYNRAHPSNPRRGPLPGETQ